MKWLMVTICLLFAGLASANTTLTAQEVSETPYTLSWSAADVASGHQVANPNGDVFLLFGATGTASVTIDSPTESFEIPGYGTVTKADTSLNMSDGKRVLIGPFRTRAWNNSSGFVLWSYSGIASASVLVKAFTLKSSLLR